MVIRYRGAPITRQRRWITISVATMVYQFTYVPILWLVAAELGEGQVPEGAVTVALSIVPVVLLVVAFGSRHARAPVAVLKGMGLFLVVGLGVGLIDMLVGVVAGYGAATAAALRREEGAPFLRMRAMIVAGAAAGMLLFLVLYPPAAILAGALLPFVAVGVADELTERRFGVPTTG